MDTQYSRPGAACRAVSSALSAPDLAREYTARRKSIQRSGWLERSSHNHSGGCPTSKMRTHRCACRSRSTSGGAESVSGTLVGGATRFSVQAWPSNCKTPRAWLHQKCMAAAIAGSQKHRATAIDRCAARLPKAIQATKTAPPASTQAANSTPRARLRRSEYWTEGGRLESRVTRQLPSTDGSSANSMTDRHHSQ